MDNINVDICSWCLQTYPSQYWTNMGLQLWCWKCRRQVFALLLWINSVQRTLALTWDYNCWKRGRQVCALLLWINSVQRTVALTWDYNCWKRGRQVSALLLWINSVQRTVVIGPKQCCKVNIKVHMNCIFDIESKLTDMLLWVKSVQRTVAIHSHFPHQWTMLSLP